VDISRLRVLRGTQKQSDIARKIGISQNHYSQIEKGVRSPSIKIYIKLCNFFNVSAGELLDRPKTAEIEIKPVMSFDPMRVGLSAQNNIKIQEK
jgi:transcriptional regulator with XRE-family HTH domain